MKIGWTLNGPVFECHLNTRQRDAIWFSHALVWCSNGWSSIQDKAHWLTISILNHLKSELHKVWYSNISGIQMVHTVFIHLTPGNGHPENRVSIYAYVDPYPLLDTKHTSNCNIWCILYFLGLRCLFRSFYHHSSNIIKKTYNHILE